MDKKQETQRRAEEAKAKLNEDTPIIPGAPRHDNIPVDQSGIRDVVQRQIETQEEAEKQEASATATANYNAAQEAMEDQAASDRASSKGSRKKGHPSGEKLVEVITRRKYVPHYVENDEGEVVKNSGSMTSVPAGTTLQLPASEALRAIQTGIANVTENTKLG